MNNKITKTFSEHTKVENIFFEAIIFDEGFEINWRSNSYAHYDLQLLTEAIEELRQIALKESKND